MSFPTEQLKLDFLPSPADAEQYKRDEQRTLHADGYKVLVDDYGPVRTVENYGRLIRCPADVKMAVMTERPTGVVLANRQ